MLYCGFQFLHKDLVMTVLYVNVRLSYSLFLKKKKNWLFHPSEFHCPVVKSRGNMKRSHCAQCVQSAVESWPPSCEDGPAGVPCLAP